MPEGNQIINTNEENLEETHDTNGAPDLSTDKSAEASANENIEETCNILGDDNNNVALPEGIAPDDLSTAFQPEKKT